MTTITRHDLETMLIDLVYAKKQCRKYGDHERATDAMSRVEDRLTDLLAEAKDFEDASEAHAADIATGDMPY